MEITEVRVKLVAKSRERLRAFCSITFDEAFVVRDLKVIGGGNDGGVFVAMPSRKLCDRCPRCRAKNHLRARFCSECGHKLVDQRVSRDSHGRAKIHADVAHPINTECREMIQRAVIKAYEEELERSKSPDYSPPEFDEADESLVDEAEILENEEDRTPVTAAGPHVVADVPEELETDAKVSESAFSDYDSLIAELKQEAATRDDRRRDRPWGRDKKRGRPALEPAVQEAHVSAGSEAPAKRQTEGRRDQVSGGSPSADSQRGPDHARQPRQQRPEQPKAPPTTPPKAVAAPPAPDRETGGISPPARQDKTGGTSPAAPQDQDAFGAGLG